MHKVATDFLKIITSELEYGLHCAKVATGELASAKAVSEGTTKNAHTQVKRVISSFLGL